MENTQLVSIATLSFYSAIAIGFMIYAITLLKIKSLKGSINNTPFRRRVFYKRGDYALFATDVLAFVSLIPVLSWGEDSFMHYVMLGLYAVLLYLSYSLNSHSRKTTVLDSYLD